MYDNRDVEPKTRLKRMATKDMLVNILCFKYLLAEGRTYLTDLGGEV